MTTGWEQLAAQLGVASVLAFFFFLLMKAYMKRMDDLLEDKRAAERNLVQKTEQFTASVDNFSVAIANHMAHETDVSERLCECVDENTTTLKILAELTRAREK